MLAVGASSVVSRAFGAGESLIRSEGQARVAMTAMVAGMLLNIALDPLFISVFGWGVSGAAIGSSGFIRQVSDSMVYLIGNNLLMKFGGAMYVTAYGAVFRAVAFLGMPAKAFVVSLTRPLFSLVVMFSTVRFVGAIAVVSAEPNAVAIGALIAIILLRQEMQNLGDGPWYRSVHIQEASCSVSHREAMDRSYGRMRLRSLLRY
jgi:hypothetical protein